MDSIENSYIFSLLVQILFLVVFSYVTIDTNKVLLKYAFNVEYIVSIIEFIGYLLLGFFLKSKFLTAVRYADWFITTNALLLALSLFLLHNKEIYGNTFVPFEKIWDDYSDVYYKMMITNTSMLFFGLLGETKIMNEMYSFALGMMGFIGTIYYTLYTFVGDSLINKVISFIFFGLWLLYAFAYLLSHKDKNVAYNILDLISKNSFGLFIYLYMIYG